MNKQGKDQIIEQIRSRFQRAVAIVAVDFKGMNVAEVTELRKRCRKAQLEYQVVKNTLSIRALGDSAYKNDLAAVLKQPTAFAFGYDDPFAAVKVLSEYAKGNGKMRLKGAVIDGKFYGTDLIGQLAKVPSKQELLGQVVGCVQGPLAKLVGVFSGVLRQLVVALSAIKDSKAKESN